MKYNNKFDFKNAKILSCKENIEKCKIGEIFEILKKDNNFIPKSNNMRLGPVYASIINEARITS